MAGLQRVSFPIAQAIKEAGYPQECGLWYNKKGIEFSYTEDYSECYARPTYIEVWLWLWREKRICIDTDSVWIKHRTGCSIMINDENVRFIERDDPEEAIIAAIKHIVTNNLLK